MQLILRDEQDYYPVIEAWLREFVCTMDDGDLEAGDRSGDEPFGVKIIFDGYGILEYEDENGEYVCEENGNKDMMSFAVFVHKNSLEEEFPEHDFTPWCLIHRPKEEICIHCWYDVNEDFYEIGEIENDEVDVDEFIGKIMKIAENTGYELIYG
jgi:hypothetical protein